MRRGEMGAAPHLHKDKAELVHVGGRPLHKRPPWVCSGMELLVMFSQVGGTWEDRTDELSGWQEPHLCSPGSAREGGCGIVGTRRRSAFCNFVIWFCGIETTCQHKWTADKT